MSTTLVTGIGELATGDPALGDGSALGGTKPSIWDGIR